jgi:hypothetical protein
MSEITIKDILYCRDRVRKQELIGRNKTVWEYLSESVSERHWQARVVVLGDCRHD